MSREAFAAAFIEAESASPKLQPGGELSVPSRSFPLLVSV